MATIYGPRKNLRLQNFSYSSRGAYFITIKTRADIVFGRIVNEMVTLYRPGIIADTLWKKIPNIYPNIVLDKYVIMPDHIHGIIFIMENELDEPNYARCGLISRIIKSYKEAVTKTVKSQIPGSFFGWQRSFYDHIINSNEELAQIRKYIIQNPLNEIKRL